MQSARVFIHLFIYSNSISDITKHISPTIWGWGLAFTKVVGSPKYRRLTRDTVHTADTVQ